MSCKAPRQEGANLWSRRWTRRVVFPMVTVFCLLPARSVRGAEGGEPIKVLFVGNSYTKFNRMTVPVYSVESTDLDRETARLLQTVAWESLQEARHAAAD